MELVPFARDDGYAVTAFGSAGVTLSPLTEPLGSGAPFQAACFRLDPGGRIGRHAASAPQLLAVVAGDGWVTGADDVRTPIVTGQAAYWVAGEEHETGTDTGLTAIVIEAPELVVRRA